MAMKYSVMVINGEMIKQDNKVFDEYLKKAADLQLVWSATYCCQKNWWN